MLCGMTAREFWIRLGDAVRRRRERLGLTQEDVASKGGPSTATLRSIEAAAAESYRAKTLYALDEALGWIRGTAVAIAEGEVPWHSLLTYDEFLEHAIRDVSGQISAGTDFPVGQPEPVETTTDVRRRMALQPIDVRPGELTTDEIAEAIRLLLDELHRRALSGDGRPATVASSAGYGLAAREGRPAQVIADALEPDPNVDPDGPEAGA
jgi:hypothetical protein